jgi:hypothetical protein
LGHQGLAAVAGTHRHTVLRMIHVSANCYCCRSGATRVRAVVKGTRKRNSEAAVAVPLPSLLFRDRVEGLLDVWMQLGGFSPHAGTRIQFPVRQLCRLCYCRTVASGTNGCGSVGFVQGSLDGVSPSPGSGRRSAALGVRRQAPGVRPGLWTVDISDGIGCGFESQRVRGCVAGGIRVVVPEEVVVQTCFRIRVLSREPERRVGGRVPVPRCGARWRRRTPSMRTSASRSRRPSG